MLMFVGIVVASSIGAIFGISMSLAAMALLAAGMMIVPAAKNFSNSLLSMV